MGKSLTGKTNYLINKANLKGHYECQKTKVQNSTWTISRRYTKQKYQKIWYQKHEN